MNSSNMKVQGRAEKVFMGTYSRYPAAMVKGEGCLLVDADGRQYLDFLSGIAVCSLGHCHPAVTAAVKEQVEVETKYAGYIARENRRIEKVRELEHQTIALDFDYWALKTISYESREKLSRIRPESIAQASRIPGISPVDIAILAIGAKSA